MIGRGVVVAAMVAGLCAPTAARAAEGTPTCVPAPVGTVGLHVEVGNEEVHVPAVSDAKLCVVVWPVLWQEGPVDLVVYLTCGFPCFRLVIERGTWTLVSTRVSVYLSYTEDGVPTTVPLADVPVIVRPDNPNRVCVAMGNPIPECPPDSVAVPVPAP